MATLVEHMHSSIGEPSALEKVNTSDVDSETPLTRPLVEVANLLRSAIKRCEHKLENIGVGIGYSPSYWTRVLSCERGVTLDRLGRLPVDVQRELIQKWAAKLNMALSMAETETMQTWTPGTERRRVPDFQAIAQLVTSRRVRVTLEGL